MLPVGVIGQPEYQPGQMVPQAHENLARLETALLAMPQLASEPLHTFIAGVYVRTLYIPRGACVVGKLHKKEHVFIMQAGDCLVFTGEVTERLTAPFQMVCQPGAKRAFFAYEDSVITTVHRTDETDLEKIEAELIAKDYEELA